MFSKNDKIFQVVVESAPNSIIMVDPTGKIVFMNKHTEKLFGYSKKVLIGKNISILLPERYGNTHHEMIKKFFKNPQTRTMGAGRDLQGIKKNGEEFPVEIGLNPLKTEEGTFVLASIIDITERKKLELRERHYIKALETKNKELEQFAYIASHDLREPLQSIYSFIQLIDSDYSDLLDEVGKESIRYINDSINRMKNLIQGLLEYSRLGREAQLEELDLNDLVQEVLDDLNFSIHGSNAKITVNHLPTIKGYPVEIRLLFQNLISNAIKFRKKDVVPRIKVSSKKSKNYWRFEVSDNGIGIPSDYYEKIFTIFQRLHRREEYEGTGIGLAHCRKIIDLHHGEIWVESKPGQGSNFYFSIPFEKDKA